MMHQIKFSTEAPGLPSHEKLSGHRPVHVVETQAQIMSVALNQPHRRAIKDKDQSRAGAVSLRKLTALGRFCEAYRLADGLWQAGHQYGEVCRAGKAAMGFKTYSAREQVGLSATTLTEAQIAAMNEAAIRRWRDAEGVLRQVIDRLHKKMELLCYDELEPSPYDHGCLQAGLYRLAIHFGTLDRGINSDKRA